MFSKYTKTIIFIIILFLGICLITACNKEYENGESDKKEYHIGKSVLTIKCGIPYAIDRAKKWRTGLYLDYIKVAFNGVEELEKRKGEIMYSFYEDDAKENFDANAYVLLDMKKNSIVSFESSYGTAKVLLGGDGELKTDKWKLDIDKAIDIAFNKIGKDKILKHKEPNLVIRCWEKNWEIAVVGDKFDDYGVEVNPENGEIIRVYDNTDKK